MGPPLIGSTIADLLALSAQAHLPVGMEDRPGATDHHLQQGVFLRQLDTGIGPTLEDVIVIFTAPVHSPDPDLGPSLRGREAHHRPAAVEGTEVGKHHHLRVGEGGGGARVIRAIQVTVTVAGAGIGSGVDMEGADDRILPDQCGRIKAIPPV
ncbi:MAG: hypothetical protein Q9222_002584 [Ikaeria aurantiellina]